MVMSQSVFFCDGELMFECIGWLSAFAMNINKNLIWSIFVLCAVSLYLVAMKSSIIAAIGDIIGVISKPETDITSHFDTNGCINILIIIIPLCNAIRDIILTLMIICDKFRFSLVFNSFKRLQVNLIIYYCHITM